MSTAHPHGSSSRALVPPPLQAVSLGTCTAAQTLSYLCTDTCVGHNRDGICDEGGACAPGTDCTDCQSAGTATIANLSTGVLEQPKVVTATVAQTGGTTENVQVRAYDPATTRACAGSEARMTTPPAPTAAGRPGAHAAGHVRPQVLRPCGLHHRHDRHHGARAPHHQLPRRQRECTVGSPATLASNSSRAVHEATLVAPRRSPRLRSSPRPPPRHPPRGPSLSRTARAGAPAATRPTRCACLRHAPGTRLPRAPVTVQLPGTQAAAGAGSGAILQLNQGGSATGNQANQVRRASADPHA